MNEQTEQAKELVKSEDAVRGLVVGNRVYEPLLFAPEIVHFTAKQYIFLHSYRLGVPLEDAATKAGLSVESAERFLDKPQTKAWLQDRATKDYIKNEWAEPGKWWQQGDAWLNAPKEQKPNKNDVEIWKEFGKRVQPLSDQGMSVNKIEINISPDAIQKSKERRKFIDTQLVKEK